MCTPWEILKFSADPETYFRSILKLGGEKFNICGLDHSGSEPFKLFHCTFGMGFSRVDCLQYF